MRPVLKAPTKVISPLESDITLQHQLIGSVGAYCTYCESPLSVDIPVGRKVSVSDDRVDFNLDGRPTTISVGINRWRFGAAWVNQQLMCTACAAAKGENPGMREAIQYLQTYGSGFLAPITPKIIGQQILSDDDWNTLFTAAALSWVSPDFSTDEMGELLFGIPGDPTFDYFTYRKFSAKPAQLQANGVLRLSNDELNQAWAQADQDMVWVLPNTDVIQQFQNANPRAPDLNTRVLNTIKGLNLNYNNPTLLNGADRRVVNRTRAWDIVNTAWANLSSLVVREVNRHVDVDQVLFLPPIALVVDSIRSTLQAVGFWSLWATVFRANLQNPTIPEWQAIPDYARNLLLYSLLIEYETDTRDMASQIRIMGGKPIPNDFIVICSVIPGTDVSRLGFLS